MQPVSFLDSTNRTSLLPAQDILNRISVVPFWTVLIWIPEYVGILGNEMADTAAKEALQYEQPLLATDLILETKNQLRKQYQQCWQCSPHLLTNKLRIRTETPDSYKLLVRIYCHSKTILHRLCIWHIRFTYEHLFSKSPPQLCSALPNTTYCRTSSVRVSASAKLPLQVSFNQICHPN